MKKIITLLFMSVVSLYIYSQDIYGRDDIDNKMEVLNDKHTIQKLKEARVKNMKIYEYAVSSSVLNRNRRRLLEDWKLNIDGVFTSFTEYTEQFGTTKMGKKEALYEYNKEGQLSVLKQNGVTYGGKYKFKYSFSHNGDIQTRYTISSKKRESPNVYYKDIHGRDTLIIGYHKTVSPYNMVARRRYKYDEKGLKEYLRENGFSYMMNPESPKAENFYRMVRIEDKDSVSKFEMVSNIQKREWTEEYDSNGNVIEYKMNISDDDLYYGHKDYIIKVKYENNLRKNVSVYDKLGERLIGYREYEYEYW